MTKNLPKELTQLVDWSVTELGQVIKLELGTAGFRRIENIRRFVKSKDGGTVAGLHKLKKQIETLSKQERFHIAHAFALMLELINSCEAAYRTHRLHEEENVLDSHHVYGRVIHVLTAHPTESRNTDIIYYFKKIQKLLQRRLASPSDADDHELRSLLKWAWRIPMSKTRKPSVMDEAEYIYSLSLQEDVLDYFIEQHQKKMPFYIRTWVGGDKDGHPGVDEKSMQGSLQLSRGILLRSLKSRFDQYMLDLLPLAHAATTDRAQLQQLIQQSKSLRIYFLKLKVLKSGDALKIEKLKTQFALLSKAYEKVFREKSQRLSRIHSFLAVFPGLVVPLELREASDLVHEALVTKGRPPAITRMLKKLNAIAGKSDPRFYVRGVVLSQTESADDMRAGVRLVERCLGRSRLPVVPLFESAQSLHNSVAIVEDFLSSRSMREKISRHWSKKLEIMVGYSDSSKENGSLPSRYLISTAIESLEKKIGSYKIQPIFFHGSGGSIERGGGSVQEQTEWWPKSALDTVKVTVQGEMIYRSYAAPDILKRQIERFSEARDHVKRKSLSANSQKYLKKMADSVQLSYRETLEDPHFLDLIELATPYSFMKDLRFGSRPAKRQGSVQIKNLRAIPWVLCWTQTRSLFPTWWGVGGYWKDLGKKDKAAYKKLFKESSLFRSYVKALGFTLKKVELPVFGFYLQSSKLSREVANSYEARFHEEFNNCLKAVREISGERSLLWYRPWLETSIELRSPLIHPLNVLQLVALESKDVPLLRETVTGIASGMLTTG